MCAAPTNCLTRAELCDLLRISPRASRKMDRDGTGPRPLRVSPRLTRYPVTEVEAFMRSSGLGASAECRFDAPAEL